MWLPASRLRPDERCRRRVRSRRTSTTPGAGTARPPRARSPSPRDLVGLGDAGRCAAAHARSSPGRRAVAGDERDDRPAVADEHERLHDLVELAADGRRGSAAVGVPSANSSMRASAPASRRKEDTRSTGSGQAVYHARNLPGGALKASAEREEARVVEARLDDALDELGGGGESIENAISAFPPSFVRETAMFAMFTPASPNIVPTRPITPGRSL